MSKRLNLSMCSTTYFSVYTYYLLHNIYISLSLSLYIYIYIQTLHTDVHVFEIV